MRIGTNVAAIVANNALQKSQNNLSTSIERLSSGYKINGSKDDAAGCAISEKMRAQIRGLSQAQNNTADGVSVLNTAEGAITEIQSMLTRLKELSVQAANDVNSDDEREAIQKEIEQIITRLTEYLIRQNSIHSLLLTVIFQEEYIQIFRELISFLYLTAIQQVYME